ncbi:protein of unknown function [Nitrospira japonica]|uniref:Uncharacterized protein n=1 Tax=Nitrospira japonica TaxID=1325564 RepID=A0A1W1I3S8_9BACT|nr:protein of unknown function [Nitrospira japonica]
MNDLAIAPQSQRDTANPRLSVTLADGLWRVKQTPDLIARG